MIIVVAHNKGGVGKTTTSFNLIFKICPDFVFDQDIHRGISILASLRDEPMPCEVKTYNDKRQMLVALKEAHEADKTVLVDCGGFDSDITRAAIAVADLVIVPAADTPTERIGLSLFDRTLSEISQEIGKDIQAHLLICKTHPNKKRFPKLDAVLAQTKHLRRFETVIGFRADHYECHETGNGVTEKITTRHTAAGKEVTALAEEICQLVNI